MGCKRPFAFTSRRGANRKPPCGSGSRKCCPAWLYDRAIDRSGHPKMPNVDVTWQDKEKSDSPISTNKGVCAVHRFQYNDQGMWCRKGLDNARKAKYGYD